MSISIVNNICDGPNINVYLDNKPAIMNLAYCEHSAQINISSNTQRIKVTKNENDDVIISGILHYENNNNYLLIIAGSEDCESIHMSLHKNDMTEVPPGYAKIRFLQSAPTLGVIDILFDEQRVITDLIYGEQGHFIMVDLASVKECISVNLKTCACQSTLVGPFDLILRSGSIYNAVVSGCGNYVLNLLSVNDQCDITQADFKIEPFMGLWWKVALMTKDDMPFIPEHVTYTHLDKSIKIHHEFINNDMKVGQLIQYATILDKEKPALWCLGDCKDADCLNYIIHETDYCNYAIIGTPDRSRLIILSREQGINEKYFSNICSKLSSWGYNIERLKFA